MRTVVLAIVVSNVAFAVVVAGAGACSKSSAGPGAAGLYDASSTTCPQVTPVAAAGEGAPNAAACAACLSAQCSAELTAYASPDGCSDFIACVCPDGIATANESVVNACQTTALASGCVQAITNVDVCEDTACSTVCNGATNAVDGGDASFVSTGGSFIDAHLSATCERYASCCELSLSDSGSSATVQNDCEESASLLTDPQCEAYLVAYQDAGLGCTP